MAVDYGRIGKVVKEVRGSRPKKEIAGRAGIGPDSYAAIEDGSVQAKLHTLEKVASALGITLGTLLQRADVLDQGVPPLRDLIASAPELTEESRDYLVKGYDRAVRYDIEGKFIPPASP